MTNRMFSKNIFVSNDTTKTGLNNNDLIVGSSGGGKTGGYIIHNIYDSDENMVIADTKGTLYGKLHSHLRKKGYNVELIDAVNPQNSTIGYNPFDYIRRDEDGNFNQNDISSIASIMIPSTGKHNDAFWVGSARSVLECSISYVLEVFDKEDQNIGGLFTVIDGILTNDQKYTITFLEDAPNESRMGSKSYAYNKYLFFKRCMRAEATWACITMYLTAFLNQLNSKENQILFCNDRNIDFKKFDTEKTILFFNVSDTDRSFDKVVNLFYSQLFNSLCNIADKNQNGALRIPIRVYLDDFATNTVIDDFCNLISVIRSRNIAVSIILQSITQLETIYNHAQSSTIVTNCDHLLYLGGADVETANYLSLRTGMVPENIMNLPLDKALFIERGRKGIICDKIKPYSCLEKKHSRRTKPTKTIEKGAEVL